jgi:hypothetical protein
LQSTKNDHFPDLCAPTELVLFSQFMDSTAKIWASTEIGRFLDGFNWKLVSSGAEGARFSDGGTGGRVGWVSGIGARCTLVCYLAVISLLGDGT